MEFTCVEITLDWEVVEGCNLLGWCRMSGATSMLSCMSVLPMVI